MRARRLVRAGRGWRATAVATTTLTLALAIGCGDEDGDQDAETETTATEEVAVPEANVDADELRQCLRRETGAVGSPGKDALLAEFANEAIAEGGASFVTPSPLAQVIVFRDQVDLGEAQSQYERIANTAGLRAVGLQGDAYGNVLITYFEGAPADKAPATKCLGGRAIPVPGFETPLNPPGPGETEDDA